MSTMYFYISGRNSKVVFLTFARTKFPRGCCLHHSQLLSKAFHLYYNWNLREYLRFHAYYLYRIEITSRNSTVLLITKCIIPCKSHSLRNIWDLCLLIVQNSNCPPETSQCCWWRNVLFYAKDIPSRNIWDFILINCIELKLPSRNSTVWLITKCIISCKRHPLSEYLGFMLNNCIELKLPTRNSTVLLMTKCIISCKCK